MSSSSYDVDGAHKRIELLFSKFAAFYGHVWRSQFKEEGFLGFAKKEWREALADFTDVVLTKATIHCREFYEMPPTLPQLIQCCKQIKRRSEFYVIPYDEAPTNKEEAASYLKKCKDILMHQINTLPPRHPELARDLHEIPRKLGMTSKTLPKR